MQLLLCIFSISTVFTHCGTNPTSVFLYLRLFRTFLPQCERRKLDSFFFSPVFRDASFETIGKQQWEKESISNSRKNVFSFSKRFIPTLFCKHINFALENSTVFENRRKSLIQHCERSEIHLHFEWTKIN